MTASPPKGWPRKLPFNITIPEHSLWSNLAITAFRYPHKTAIKFFGSDISYQQLHDDAQTLAGWLQMEAGVQRGDRVLLYMQNCPQFVMAFYAVLRADAVVVPVNPMNKGQEFAHYIQDAGATVVICAAELAGFVEEANQLVPEDKRVRQLLVTRYSEALPESWLFEKTADSPPASMMPLFEADPPLPELAGGRVTRWPQAFAQPRQAAPHCAQPDDLAVMPYTSGTTGNPKGCMHTHASLMHNVVGGGIWSSVSGEAVSLAVLPMFHITGMQYGMNGPIYQGSTVVMLPRWDREYAAQAIARHHITHWTNIPTMIIDLLASPNAAQFDLSSLVYIGGGGAAMPQAVAERLKAQYDLQFIEGYGLTETAAPTHSNPLDAPKLQCLGVPIFGTESHVIDPVTFEEMPMGEVGEIISRGPQLFKGYWGNEKATADAFIQFRGKTFFRSGDLGRVDAEGYFFLTDRLKRMINASGFKVWPAEVEALLYRHPDIAEACIIATQDAYRGESVKAVVVLKPHAVDKTSGDAIIEWAKANMAAYKAPKIVEFVSALPKSGSGKVMWRALQDKEKARAA